MNQLAPKAEPQPAQRRVLAELEPLVRAYRKQRMALAGKIMA